MEKPLMYFSSNSLCE
uniref:Uncharacterized protein n=1 Tax=Anguilla anguilla TaxID=7936 RepID=A0A0E9T9D1_ANGAN